MGRKKLQLLNEANTVSDQYCPTHSRPLLPASDMPGLLWCGPECGMIVPVSEVPKEPKEPKESKEPVLEPLARNLNLQSAPINSAVINNAIASPQSGNISEMDWLRGFIAAMSLLQQNNQQLNIKDLFQNGMR